MKTTVRTWRGLIAGDCFFDREKIRMLLQAGPERFWELTEVQTRDAVVRTVLDASSGPPDCLLLSDQLENTDILTLLTELACPQGGCICPVVIFSSAGDMMQAESLLRAGAQDYVGQGWLNPSGLPWVIHNAIERWSMQRELHDHATHLQLALDASLAVVFEWDIVQDRVRRLQSVLKSMPQTNDAWDTFEGVASMVHPEDQTLFRSNVQAALNSAEGRYRSEFRLVRPDGMVCWLGERGRVEFDLQRKPVRLIGISYDITERKRSEENLRQSEARFRAVQQATPDGFMLFQAVRNEAGEIIDFEWAFVNPAAEAIVGRTDLMGKRLLREMPGNREEGLFDAYVQVVETGAGWQREFRYCQDGLDRWFQTTAVKTADGFAASFMDITDRKRAEEAMRASEKNFRAMFEVASVGKVQADPATGRFVRVNTAFCQITGYCEAELLERTIGDITHPEDLARDQTAFARMVLGESDFYKSVKRYVRRDGSIVWVQVDANLIFDSEGHPYRTAAVIQDITARKRAEDELAEQKRLYQSITDNASVALFIMDERQQCVFMNPAAEKLTGYTLAETLGKPLHDVVHHTRPDGSPYPLSECPIDQAFPKDDREQGEEAFIHKDGRFYDVAFTASPIRDAVGNSIGTIVEVQDVTERNRAAVRLRDSESFYRQTIESIPAMTFTNSPDGACDYVSEQWVEYTGIPAAEHFGSGWLKVLHPEDRERTFAAWSEAVEGRGQYAVEYRVRRHDDIYNWFKVQGRAIRDAAGTIVRWFGTALNVDDLKQAEESMKQADRRKDEFLATLAHELRNPLAPIRTGLEVMKMVLDDPPTLREICATMERQTQQLISLVDDLLEVSRITRGRLELQKCLVDLPSVLRNAVEASSPIIQEFGHQLWVNLPEESLALDADPTRLAQIVSNLLTNAAKYTPAGGQIWLSAQRQGMEVAISVRDNGIGIPGEMQQRIFEMFAQIEDRPMEKGYRGLGIGLALAKSLVEMHGGRIMVQSDGPNTGSQFTVLMPMMIEIHSRKEASTPSCEALPANRLRILVVDDNREAAEMLERMVRLLGHEAATAHDGQTGVELAGHFLPDLVLLDIGMPRMNGYEAAQYIRLQPWGEKMLLVALTGWGQDDDKRRTKEAGFDHHLVKPADVAALQQIFAATAQRTDPTQEPIEQKS
jgi:PAS domain S-box-containing protein